MKANPQLIQTAFAKVSDRKWGASSDPHARLALLQSALDKLHAQPFDQTALTHALLFVLDTARKLGLSADDLVSMADSQVTIWREHLALQAKQGVVR